MRFARVFALGTAAVVVAGCAGSQVASDGRPGPSGSSSPPDASRGTPHVAVATPNALFVPDGEKFSGATTRRRRLVTWDHPGGAKDHAIKTTNPLGQRLVFLVAGVQGARVRPRSGWYEVYIPERPNGSTAWVRGRDVRLVSLHQRIEIDLSDYSLAWFKGDRLVDRFRVGIGRNQWPTPTGTFFVWAKVPQPGFAGPYGVYALGLSGFSSVLSDWPGGGRAAIHGTAAAWNRGRKVSHGCIRVFNPDMQRLKHVPMGTPVMITR